MSVSVSYPNPQTAVLTPADGEEWGAGLDSLIDSNSEIKFVILDFINIRWTSSANLLGILELKRKIPQHLNELVVINLSPGVAQLFRSTGIDRLVRVSKSLVAELAEPANQKEHRREVASAASYLPANERFTSHHDSDQEFPVITEEDYRFADDWSFIEEQQAQGAFDQYPGKFVGVYKREIIGVSRSENELRGPIADSKGIAGELPAVHWVVNDEFR